MIIVVENKALLGGISPSFKKIVKSYLTIANPLFFKRLDMGLANWGVQQQLEYYEEIGDESIEVPIGALPTILDKAAEFGEVIDEVLDKRNSNLCPDYFSNLNFNGTLRDYQQDMVNACKNNGIGVLEAMTGSGKTITFVALTLMRKEPTLILVNTIELANQTVEAFTKFTNLKHEDIGFVGSGRMEIKPVTVGILQTFTNLEDKYFDIFNEKFGQVISDEVHIIAATTFYATMAKLKAKYKYGFSATPSREDGLTDVIHFAVGPTIHIVPKEKLEDVLITPTYSVVNTEYYFPLLNTSEYQFMLTDMARDNDRNDSIIKYFKNSPYKDKPTCMLCNRTDQVDYLKNALGDIAVELTSKTKKKERKRAMELLKAGTKNIVVSTYGLFSTGIDIPQLEVLLLCAPIQSENKLRQAAGRLMRMYKGKNSATIIDFVDKKIDLLRGQARKRYKIFHNL